MLIGCLTFFVVIIMIGLSYVIVKRVQSVAEIKKHYCEINIELEKKLEYISEINKLNKQILHKIGR